MTKHPTWWAILFFATLCTSWAQADDPKAAWVWSGKSAEESKIWLRKKFTLETPVKTARVTGTCDNQFKLFLNGSPVLNGRDWNSLEAADVTKLLKQGENILAVEATNEGGPAGLLVQLKVTGTSGQVVNVVSDASWLAAAEVKGKWQQADFDDAAWKPAQVLGAVGDKSLPWSGAVNNDSLLAMLDGVSESEFTPRLAENVTAPEGFKVEKIFQVPRSMGSWVSLAVDPQGRLIASDQGDAGLFLITPPTEGKPTQVQKLPVNLSSAQGLLWAFDSLYAVVNGRGSGLHRLQDTNGDGLVDASEHLMPVPGGGEHGPHGVVLSPDGQSLYIAAGNHTNLPPISGSRLPQNWGEDLLLPRRWDANGHAAGRLAPGGWICKVDPAGKQWEVVSSGYRNEYDLAFNADGELFSYDADMEWDFGSPWYRPTRVCHAVSGSEFGWRSGTGKWPTYYEDSLPPVVDIGPGSPVGVTFGYGAKFPAKYQKALYLLDWTYSTIYAVHLTPDGASYRGEKQDFITGTPLPVTDAVVGQDGAMYFTVGGRGTQSALFRVTYVGTESTAPAVARDTQGVELRQLRQKLEAMHGKPGGDLDFICANLGHADRFIRYAARIALESQPVDAWRGRALAEEKPRAAVTALMALARQGKPEDRDAVLSALGRLDLGAQLDTQGQLALLRTYMLACIRLGEPTAEQKAALIKKFDPMFPSSVEALNAELVQLLVYWQSPTVVGKTLAMMEKLGAEPVPDWGHFAQRNAGYGGTVQRMIENMPPVRGIHYTFVLRNAKEGWTVDSRRQYFSFFQRAAQHPGGASYPGFLSQIREEAFAAVPVAERVTLDEIVGRPLQSEFKVNPPVGPGRKWTKELALEAIGKELRGRNYDKGRNLFHATSCAKCHRYNAEGGAIGPDLSTASRKFSLSEMLDSIFEPSKVISDQYGSHQVVTTGGQMLIGRVVELGDELHIYTLDPNAPPKVIKKTEVDEMIVSKLSQMPVGLVDTLNGEELQDLLAYLLSAGNKNHAVYKK